jgi:Derlin-2/3
MKAPYIPWFYILMNICFGVSIQSDLMGVFTGHLYYFTTEILPHLPNFKDKRPLATPQFL